MKKTILCMLLVFAIFPLFAEYDMLSVNMGLKYEIDRKANSSETDLAIDLSGTTYFGEKETSGITYGISLDKMLSAKSSGVDVSQDQIDAYSLNSGFYLQYAHRFPLNEKLSIGITIGGGMHAMDFTLSNATANFITVDIKADTSLIYYLSRRLAISASLGLDCPFYSHNKGYVNGNLVDEYEEFGFSLKGSAKIGISYLY